MQIAGDHGGHMITNLKSAKARLSELVQQASEGEEIWLTVRGVPKARLCPLPPDHGKAEKESWVDSIREARARYGQQSGPSDEQSLWDDLRGE